MTLSHYFFEGFDESAVIIHSTNRYPGESAIAPYLSRTNDDSSPQKDLKDLFGIFFKINEDKVGLAGDIRKPQPIQFFIEISLPFVN
jgi:hypothetical protein